MSSRRILALFLPNLLIELTNQQPPKPHAAPALRTELSKGTSRNEPTAVLLTDPSSPPSDPNAVLDAVNFAARKLGVFAGQSVAQACTLVENLNLISLPKSSVFSALTHLADVALGYGTPVSLGFPDTVWIDISGTSHLFGGERELALQIRAHLHSLGHRARVATADGPWLARAFARYRCFDASGVLQIDEQVKKQELRQLPVSALPLKPGASAWFARLGLLHMGDLQKLPQSALASRLAGQLLEAKVTRLEAVLGLIQGHDPGVLVPYEPQELPSEESFWDEPTETVEPLLFVMKGLAARIGARLEGRGQAALEFSLILHHDRSVAALRGLGSSTAPSTQTLHSKLAAPLTDASDIERIARARLQSLSLQAPATGLSLSVTAVTCARRHQLGLSASMGLGGDPALGPQALAVLIGELTADVGEAAVGVLMQDESHLLEKRSRLSALKVLSSASISNASTPHAKATERFGRDTRGHSGRGRLPTRILTTPVDVSTPLRKDTIVVLGRQAFVIEDVRFEHRLEDIEWWTSTRIFRDYFRVWLTAISSTAPLSNRAGSNRADFNRTVLSRRASTQEGLEALFYWDRNRERGYLQALYD